MTMTIRPTGGNAIIRPAARETETKAGIVLAKPIDQGRSQLLQGELVAIDGHAADSAGLRPGERVFYAGSQAVQLDHEGETLHVVAVARIYAALQEGRHQVNGVECRAPQCHGRKHEWSNCPTCGRATMFWSMDRPGGSYCTNEDCAAYDGPAPDWAPKPPEPPTA